VIDPQYHWCLPIDITNICNRACSNCTRMVGHSSTFCMDTEQFSGIIDAIKDFPQKSPPTKSEGAPNFKLIGLIGGEPLFHPKFPELLDILKRKVPKENRGLWTSLDWQHTKHAEIIEDSFTPPRIHNNRHDLNQSQHSPVLVAIQDVIKNSVQMWKIINNCWLQKRWCGSITPKGYFFCEVAGVFDWVFNGPGGLPVESECWKRPLVDFQSQIDQWCPMCGVPLQLKGRIDSEEIDDISQSNLDLLEGSPRVQKSDYILYRDENETVSKPWEYKT